jgi:glycosyltransferase involved in cell wall biosynthesis
MKKTKIINVYGAYNLEKHIEQSLKLVKEGINSHPEIDFLNIITDDGSSDNTYEVLKQFSKKYKLNTVIRKNETNKGLVQTLKDSYQEALKYEPNYVLKTDLDTDFNQKLVFDNMINAINSKTQIIAGTRYRKIKEEDNPYEYKLREEIVGALNKKYGITELDPPSMGTQLYNAEYLPAILNWEEIKNHNERWGLDFAIPLAGIKKGMNVKVVQIPGNYDALRRPEDKVLSQYTKYAKIMSKQLGTDPKKMFSFIK